MRFVAKSAVAKSEVERYILYYFSVGAKRFGRYYRCVAKPNVAKCEVDCSIERMWIMSGRVKSQGVGRLWDTEPCGKDYIRSTIYRF